MTKLMSTRCKNLKKLFVEYKVTAPDFHDYVKSRGYDRRSVGGIAAMKTSLRKGEVGRKYPVMLEKLAGLMLVDRGFEESDNLDLMPERTSPPKPKVEETAPEQAEMDFDNGNAMIAAFKAALVKKQQDEAAKEAAAEVYDTIVVEPTEAKIEDAVEGGGYATEPAAVVFDVDLDRVTIPEILKAAELLASMKPKRLRLEMVYK